MTQHTPENDTPENDILSAALGYLGSFDMRLANLTDDDRPAVEAQIRRIVSCVNACAGIGDGALDELGSVAVESKLKLLELWREAGQQHDELLALLEQIHIESYGGELSGETWDKVDSAITKHKAQGAV